MTLLKVLVGVAALAAPLVNAHQAGGGHLKAWMAHSGFTPAKHTPHAGVDMSFSHGSDHGECGGMDEPVCSGEQMKGVPLCANSMCWETVAVVLGSEFYEFVIILIANALLQLWGC